MVMNKKLMKALSVVLCLILVTSGINTTVLVAGTEGEISVQQTDNSLDEVEEFNAKNPIVEANAKEPETESLTEESTMEEPKVEVTTEKSTTEESEQKVEKKTKFTKTSGTVKTLTSGASSTSVNGTGTEDQPYQICTEEQLIALALGTLDNAYKAYYRRCNRGSYVYAGGGACRKKRAGQDRT